MIKIEIDAATGAEARLELLNLLGVSGILTAPVKQTKEEFEEKIHETAVALKENYEDTQRLEATREKGKRRTKAEIEAEKKTAEPDTSQAPEGPVDAEQAAKDKEAIETGAALADTVTEYPTLQDLQRICAILVRAGYKQQGIDFIKNVGNADTSKDVAEDKRQACIDAMTKFAEENKIAL